MSTRALYTFKGTEGDADWNVYKHHDGYPSGAVRTIKTAIDWFAWGLPRYESDEFAAAFCAAGKISSWFEDAEQLLDWAKRYGPGGEYHSHKGGGIRFMPSGNPSEVACQNCSDIEYRYEISMGTPLPEYIEKRARNLPQAPTLLIKAFCGDWWDGVAKEKQLYAGTFDKFFKWATKKDKVAA